MNWLIKAIEKLTRPLVVVLKKTKNPRRVVLGLNLTTVGVFLGAALVGLVPLGTVLGALVGGVPLLVLGKLLEPELARAVAREREMARKNKEENGSRLILPPGAGLRDMLHFIYPPKTAERVFDQIIADTQLEWQEAMIHEKTWLARWVRVRGVVTVFLTAAVYAVATLGSILKLVR